MTEEAEGAKPPADADGQAGGSDDLRNCRNVPRRGKLMIPESAACDPPRTTLYDCERAKKTLRYGKTHLKRPETPLMVSGPL